jgi:hypothetical protein
MVKLNIIIKLIIISLKEKYFQNRNIMNDAFGIIIKTYDTKSQYLYLKGVLNKIGAAFYGRRRKNHKIKLSVHAG